VLEIVHRASVGAVRHDRCYAVIVRSRRQRYLGAGGEPEHAHMSDA
jgi:hypothetical protein